jgi:glutamate synthase (ferredoxin)
MNEPHLQPGKQGLYDPRFEHDSCGVGFVADLKGRKSHTIVQKAIEILINLEHRGACGCEKDTGDGAGISIQMPHDFFADWFASHRLVLPDFGHYGVGMLFLPTDPDDRQRIEQMFAAVAIEEGLTVLGWRDVPTDNSLLGPTARASQPIVKQIFVARGAGPQDDLAFERRLFIVRRRVAKAVKRSDIRQRGMFYVASFHTRQSSTRHVARRSVDGLLSGSGGRHLQVSFGAGALAFQH